MHIHDLQPLFCFRIDLRAMSTKKPGSRKWRLHHGGYLAGEAASWRLLLELEIHISQTFLLLEYPFLRWRLLEQRNILKEDLYNLLVILQAILS